MEEEEEERMWLFMYACMCVWVLVLPIITIINRQLGLALSLLVLTNVSFVSVPFSNFYRHKTTICLLGRLSVTYFERWDWIR